MYCIHDCISVLVERQLNLCGSQTHANWAGAHQWASTYSSVRDSSCTL